MSSRWNQRFHLRKIPVIACIGVAAVLCLTLGSAVPMHAQQNLGVQPAKYFNEAGLDVLQIRPNVYMIAGAGGNIVAHLGWMGIVLVDAGAKDKSSNVLSVLNRITEDKIRFIIDTGPDDDHVGGNEALSQAGRTMLNYVRNPDGTGGFGGGDFQTNNGAAAMFAHENVLNYMSGRGAKGEPPYPAFGWPNELFNGARMRSLYLNSDPVQIAYQPAAHTDADVIAYFRRADVLAVGDLVDLRHFPVIDTNRGGTVDGIIDALTRLVEMSTAPVPLTWHEDRTLIVPGHGRLMDHFDLVEYRDMVKIIRDRVVDLMRKGMNVEQVKAANPTQGFSKQYGPTTGPWTNDMFVEAIFKTVNAKQ
jgi:glyoxylase-like metal-dependent hydrolase (beta-lactamase superfamily II)